MEAESSKATRPSWRTRAIHALIVVAVSAAIAVITVRAAAPRLSAFDAPQTALYGPAFYDAHLAAAGFALLGYAALAVLAIIAVIFTRPRYLAILPLLMLPAIRLATTNAARELERTPALLANFADSRRALDAAADRIQHGETPETPFITGSFTIVGYEALPSGAIALYTQINSDEWSEHWGFVRFAGLHEAEIEAAACGFAGRLGEDHHVRRLADDWFVLFHWYWFIKRGWS